jgi:protein NEDD1
MLSCGFDKRCVCYDINAKRSMSNFKTDFPLTSVDFGSDGTTLALGTINGKILIYDLRYKTVFFYNYEREN